ncbi:hypothetical protein KAS08_02240 [Candidatus Pacearchaeota archaeon]|nr:hypothetical protein [Candidatus Pacearchaeota archaeon]
MDKVTLGIILLGILLIGGMIGGIFLTIWLWKVLPHWIFFLLCGINLLGTIVSLKLGWFKI